MCYATIYVFMFYKWSNYTLKYICEQIHLTFSFNLILDEEECLYYCSTCRVVMSNIHLRMIYFLFILIFHHFLSFSFNVWPFLIYSLFMSHILYTHEINFTDLIILNWSIVHTNMILKLRH